MATPSDRLVTQTPIAIVRCRGSSNIVRISDSVEGISVAPATPSRARAAMSIPGLVENAASTEAPANVAPPISSRRRRPILSPSVPIVMSDAAIRNP
jgi:hypothetical protein